MGGGYYSQDVAREARSTDRDVWGSTPAATRALAPGLDIKGRIRECVNASPVVVALDVTRSRGDDTKLVYEQLPMMLDQIERHAYLDGVAISFAAIGDATDGDRGPLQVGQFEADNRLDAVLEQFWIEEGGGGSGQESYELAAWFYAHHSVLACQARGARGIFFFVGDEGFYPKVSREQILRICGRTVADDVDAAAAFAALQEKYEVFFLYCRQAPETRRANIDAEIRQRVTAAGGRYEGVDIRASLVWNNHNDLDLHCIAPSGEHVYYGHKRSQCGGWLDVDQNVRGETTKPVENIQWAKGTAPAGTYRFFVRDFALHGARETPTRFRVELEIDGRFQHVDGTISPKGETGDASDVQVAELVYDPDASGARQATYDAYSDATVLDQWRGVLPPAHVLEIDDPTTIVDVMLGVIAIVGGRTLDATLDDLAARGQSEVRRAQVVEALGAFGASTRSVSATSGPLPAGDPSLTRGGGAKRLR